MDSLSASSSNVLYDLYYFICTIRHHFVHFLIQRKDGFDQAMTFKNYQKIKNNENKYKSFFLFGEKL